MPISPNITPFSQSILIPAQKESLRQMAVRANISGLAAPDAPTPARVAAITSAVWGIQPEVAAHLLGTVPPAAPVRGKASRGIKLAQKTLEEFPAIYTRMKRWSEWVFASEWSQAQLLQVMEEVEPMTTEAMAWMQQLALAAVGSYAHLGNLLARFEKDAAQAHALRLGLTAGIETPASQLLAELAEGVDAVRVQELFGHMTLQNPCEIAQPRLKEMSPSPLRSERPASAPMWNQERARQRYESAQKEALARAGLLGRSGLRKTIALTRDALAAHAQARDALAHVLAATRHWALAAAFEGMSDGRIQAVDEIFMLEIEEIKQMMTGEWHSREHVEPLIAQRRQAQGQEQAPTAGPRQPLGVAGSATRGKLVILSAPSTEIPDNPSIVLASESPAWWQVILQAQDVIDTGGNLLSWLAAVARAGNLPAVVGGESYAAGPAGADILLDPSRHHSA